MATIRFELKMYDAHARFEKLERFNRRQLFERDRIKLETLTNEQAYTLVRSGGLEDDEFYSTLALFADKGEALDALNECTNRAFRESYYDASGFCIEVYAVEEVSIDDDGELTEGFYGDEWVCENFENQFAAPVYNTLDATELYWEFDRNGYGDYADDELCQEICKRVGLLEELKAAEDDDEAEEIIDRALAEIRK